MEVYIDIIIIENFIINLFLLLLTFRLMRFQYKKRYIYIAAFIGALYTVAIFSKIEFITSIWIKVIIALIMISISIDRISITSVCKCTVAFFLSSLILCGLCFGMVTMQNDYTVGKEFTITNFSIKWLLLATMILYIVMIRVSETLKDRALVKNFMYDIHITIGEQVLKIKGFLDTGNELREVASNLPCIIIEEKYLREIELKDREIFIINYKTISENGKIEGFKGDKVMIRNTMKNEWVNVEAMLCKSQAVFSKENDYQALLSRGVI